MSEDYDPVVSEIFPRVHTFKWNEVFLVSLMQATTTVGALRVTARSLASCKPEQRDWRPCTLLRTLEQCAKTCVGIPPPAAAVFAEEKR